MRPPLAVALVLGLLALPNLVWSREDEVLCELSRVDRTKTHSFTCLACHDGSIATSLHTNLGDGSHPVERDYREAAADPARRLTPVSQLSRRLVLVDGLVTCTTCHDPKSSRPSHLAMPMEGSAMCMACHRY
ncbi:MAG TPA: cytochrome c3 family protein [Myxococcales bacterium]|jgi:predicted CXXCH cytochrome family protein